MLPRSSRSPAVSLVLQGILRLQQKQVDAAVVGHERVVPERVLEPVRLEEMLAGESDSSGGEWVRAP